jgi:F-type H+-transporting ATPase subunit epsilon
MPKLDVEVVSAERVVFAGEADMVVAPGTEGVLGILPKHAALLTSLTPGVLRIKQGADEVVLAVSGGFLEVHNDKVEVLTDAAERAEDIDETRAEEARQKDATLLAAQPPGRGAKEVETAEAALRRSLARLKVTELRRRRGQQR